MRLHGKTVIITGGASGIGKAATELFVKAGAEVVIADVNVDEGHAVAAKTGARFIRCDVTDSESVKAVIAACPKLDVIYNNAAVFWNGRDGRITDIDETDWERILAINLGGVYRFCK